MRYRISKPTLWDSRTGCVTGFLDLSPQFCMNAPNLTWTQAMVITRLPPLSAILQASLVNYSEQSNHWGALSFWDSKIMYVPIYITFLGILSQNKIKLFCDSPQGYSYHKPPTSYRQHDRKWELSVIYGIRESHKNGNHIWCYLHLGIPCTAWQTQ